MATTLTDRVARLAEKLRRLHAESRDEGLAAPIERRLRDRLGIAELAAAHDVHRAQANAGDQRLADLLQASADRIRVLEQSAQIGVVMDWVSRIPVPEGPLISVVMPTYQRAHLVPRAIDSVLSQSYGSFELIVIDDCSTDGTQETLAAIDDPRVRVKRVARSGAGRARNEALAITRGEIVAYLDDDNIMHPNWLKTIVWAFEQRPEADVVYGGWVIDDVDRLEGTGHGQLPRVIFHEFDRRSLEGSNLADMSALAHRARAGMRFNEEVPVYSDWDLLLRLTAEKAPFAVPAIACYYTTDAPNRISTSPDIAVGAQLVRDRVRELRAARNGDPGSSPDA